MMKELDSAVLTKDLPEQGLTLAISARSCSFTEKRVTKSNS